MVQNDYFDGLSNFINKGKLQKRTKKYVFFWGRLTAPERDKNTCVVDINPLEAIFRGASGSIEGAAGFLADFGGLQAQGAAGSWRAVVNTASDAFFGWDFV